MLSVHIDFYYFARYIFPCNDWLAFDASDGRIERELKVCTSAEYKDPCALLEANVTRKLFDDHIWLSVGYRQTKSNFSRVQRLAVCLATLFLAMVANAMW